MTPEEIRQRLLLVETSELTGQLPERFSQVQKITGLFWKDVLMYFATQGYSSEDAARFYGTKGQNLRAVVRRRNVDIPWQRTQGSAYRQHMSNLKKGKAFYHPPKRQFTAFGHTMPLDELLEMYGDPSVTYDAAYNRIRRGWDIEQALTAPIGQPLGRASPRYKKAA